MANNLMDERLINRSPEAPLDGVYRYELIPAETPMDYYIDLWYQFAMGDEKKLLDVLDDAVYLKAGEYVEINEDGEPMVRKKGSHLKLIVNNN
jgi:hypothetical protein